MKATKQINRKLFLEFLMKTTGTKNITQQSLCGKNMYFLTADNKQDVEFQIEFIPQSKRYFFTVYMRGINKEADYIHEDVKMYLDGLKLGRNVMLDTESKVTMIN